MAKDKSAAPEPEYPAQLPADPVDAARAAELARQRKVVNAVHDRTHEGSTPIPIVQPGPENAEPET
jgi:hypothetical protein